VNYEGITEHKASFPYSVELKRGDIVTVTDREEDGWVWCIDNGKQGAWIPKAYINQKDSEATMLTDYDSTELDVLIGEKLKGITMERGWMLCINSRGQKGWVPADKIKTRARTS
jgi:uncharacterized protein YgiM (DUF1202 family)